jgi:hypothetical protein
MHTGDCWKKAHCADPKIRKQLKRKRVQPEIAHGDTGVTKRVKKSRRRRGSLFPGAQHGAGDEEQGEEGEEGMEDEEGDEGDEDDE